MQSEAPLTMDPGDQTASLTADVLDPIYEGLTKLDAHMSVIPSLATSWSVDPTGMQWTFQLRKDVHFQDGTNFNAQAVVHSYERLTDPTRGLAGGSRVRGIIASVEATHPYTVFFTLRRRYAPFLRVTAVIPIVSPDADAKGTLSRYAVGTGPFRFREWRTGEYVLEERNASYWGPQPPMEQLMWTWSSERVLMNMSVLTGESSLVNPMPPIFAEALQQSRRVRLLQGEETVVFWIALNMQEAALADLRVRQALSYATDREALVRTQLRGFGKAADSPLSPSEFGYLAQPNAATYNPALARTLLANAGYRSGLKLRMAVQEEDAGLAEALQGMWSRVGVQLEVDVMEYGVYSQTIFGTPRQKHQAGIDCVLASWASNNGDPDFQLGPLYRSSAWSPAGANVGFYSNPQLDTLLTNAAAEMDEEKRRKLYAEAQRTIVQDTPHILIYYTRDLAAEHVGAVAESINLLSGGQLRFGLH